MFRWIDRMTPHWPGAMAGWAMLAVLTVAGLARDKDAFRGDQPPPPPEPNPLDIEVSRGGPVWITLSAYSLTSPIIRYRIRRPPKAGQLGKPQMVTADTAMVRYKPPAGAGPGEDGFAYAVQSFAGVSAPAEVRIRITDADPLLVAPDEIDFGELLPGESARRLLVIQNIGGGLAQGSVRVPDAWTVEGDPAYRLEAGAKQSFTLVFTPREERKYTGDVEYTGNLDRATDLDGKEVAPIEVTAEPVELHQVGKIRVGVIHVQNRTNVAHTLRVTAGPHLEMEKSVEVPPKGGTDIVMRAKEGEDEEIHDSVTVEGEGMKTDISVHAATVREVAQSQVANVPVVSTSAVAEPANTVNIAVNSTPGLTGVDAPDDISPDGMDLLPLTSDLANTTEQETGTPVMPLEVESSGEDEATVTCNFSAVEPGRSWRVEAQTVKLDPHGRPEAIWVPLANVTVEAHGSSVSAHLEHLRRSALYVVRVVGLDEQGKLVAMSSAGQVWTARAREQGHWGWVAAGTAILAAVVLWRWKKRQKGACAR